MQPTQVSADAPTFEASNTTGADDGPSSSTRRDPVGWTMWSLAAIIAIAGVFMASIALGRSDSQSATAAGGSNNESGTPATQPATATGATIDFQATPAADWTPYDPTLKPADGATEHKLTMHATEKVLEIAPGVTQEMWTFDDKVPGATLRGNVGDLFTITLVNDGKLAHSIDLHASKVAWNVEMKSINPGESIVYQFKAKLAGAFMYHCGTAPALHHIGNGMYGAIIIDPPRSTPAPRASLAT